MYLKKKIKAFITRCSEKLKAFGESKSGKFLVKMISILATSAIIGYLIYKLSLIGWDKVRQSLPTTPWFYVLLLAMFFCLPIFQTFIYRVAWKVSRRELFMVLLNKRVLDKDVLGYSGEMYLYMWARKTLKLPDREVLHVVKDNVIISSAASTMVAVVLLILFFIFGRVKLPEAWINPGIFQVAVAILCIVMVVALVIKFRKSLFFLEKKQILAIFYLHIARLLVVQGLQVIQWVIVMPEIPVMNWMTLLATQIIITRVPLLPSRDLLFMGTGIEMSQMIQVSTSSMAGMLLASSVINKILNLVFFVTVYLYMKRKPLSNTDENILETETVTE